MDREKLIEKIEYNLKHNYPENPSMYVNYTELLLEIVQEQQEEIKKLKKTQIKFITPKRELKNKE